MDIDESVTQWIDGLRAGDSLSAQQLWQRYFRRLVDLAEHKLPGSVRRDFDEEDVALSAFFSLCQGVKNQRFPRLDDRQNLWSLLVVITARKVMHRLRDATRQKRGGGRVSGESGFLPAGDTGQPPCIDQIIGDEPTPEFALCVSEESERLLKLLPDEDMQRLAVLKMEGFTNAEAADELRCSLRTSASRPRCRCRWSTG